MIIIITIRHSLDSLLKFKESCLSIEYPGNFSYVLPTLQSTFVGGMSLYPRMLGRKRVIHQQWKGNVVLCFSAGENISKKSSSDSWGSL
jgi:hypothetical protein